MRFYTIIMMFGIIINIHTIYSLSRFEWTNLKLRFKIFKSFPTTESAAIQDGFSKVSDCESNPHFRGKQYIKNEDPQVILLFDVNGFIAGLQSGVPNDLENGFPADTIQPPYIADGDIYKLTAYFTDPSTICRRGRSEQRIRLHGIAEYLLIQNGTRPEEDLIEVSLEESQTKWVKGLCFPGMGFHYFNNIQYEMDCANFFPVALLYYHGQLKGFVWSLGAVLNSTTLPYEYPEPSFFDELMEEVPLCLKTLRRSTLHIYFEDDPTQYDCVNFEKPTCSTSGAALTRLVKSLLVACMVQRLLDL